jgi:hypothetical protein
MAVLVGRRGSIGWSGLVRPWALRGGHSRSGVTSLHDADRDRYRGQGSGRFDGRRDDLANQINASVGSIRTLLPGITDAASAQAALPKLKEAVAQLNEVSSRAAQLSPEGKSTLVKLIVVATPTINQMCDKVLATPGAGDIAKPAIDELRGKLDTLART